MLKLRKMFKNKKGFTLIELIVVIAILAILALLAIPRFLNTLENARISTDEASARTIVSAVALYQAEIQDPNAQPAIGDLTTDGYIDANLSSAQGGTAFVINYTGTTGVVSTVTLTGTVTQAQVYPAID